MVTTFNTPTFHLGNVVQSWQKYEEKKSLSVLSSHTCSSFVFSTGSWFQVKDSPVFHPQDNVAKASVFPVSLNLQTHLKGWMDFKSNLAEPEA